MVLISCLSLTCCVVIGICLVQYMISILQSIIATLCKTDGTGGVSCFVFTGEASFHFRYSQSTWSQTRLQLARIWYLPECWVSRYKIHWDWGKREASFLHAAPCWQLDRQSKRNWWSPSHMGDGVRSSERCKGTQTSNEDSREVWCDPHTSVSATGGPFCRWCVNVRTFYTLHAHACANSTYFHCIPNTCIHVFVTVLPVLPNTLAIFTLCKWGSHHATSQCKCVGWSISIRQCAVVHVEYGPQ